MLNHNSIKSQLVTDLSFEESQQQEFDLYLQVNELKRLYQGLDKIRHKSRVEREKIVLENEDFLEDLQEEIMLKTQEVLSEISLTPELVDLTAEYAGQVRDLFNLIQELQSVSSTKKC